MAVEFLRGIDHSSKTIRVLDALEAAISKTDKVVNTRRYQGNSEWLAFWGIGAAPHNAARNIHRTKGRVLMLDMGYTRGKYRISIDDDHPHRWMDKTPEGVWPGELLDTHNPKGPVLLIGLGKKSRKYLNSPKWEADKYKELRKEFPKERIVFRPKDGLRLGIKTDAETPFNELVKGASLVVARHSNCCVDAAIAGVPFRCEDGAAFWLKDLKDRRVFLNKLARWEYPLTQMDEAWKFAKEIAQ